MSWSRQLRLKVKILAWKSSLRSFLTSYTSGVKLQGRLPLEVQKSIEAVSDIFLH